MRQIFTLKKINGLVRLTSGKKVVMAGGCFDIVHLGHVKFLEESKKYGDILIVLLESDEMIKSNKGDNRPINNQKNRALFLTKLKAVDAVLCLPKMNDEDYKEVVLKLKPKIIAVTEKDVNLDQKTRQAEIAGAEVVEVTKLVPHQSTSRVIEIINQDF